MTQQQPSIIFVEGVPFTGKSTTAEYITSQLNLNGYRTRWLPEWATLERFPHTVAALDRQEQLSEATVRAEWSAFVEQLLADDAIYITDSALSVVGLAVFMMEDRPQEVIDAEMRQLAQVCAPLRPRVVHLVGDVARLLPASIVERGAGWEAHIVRQAEVAPYQQARGRSGVEGAIQMLHDEQLLLRETLARDGWKALTLDVTDPDWAANQRAILDFLELKEVIVERPSIERDVLESYTGTYTIVDSERPPTTLAVQLEDDGLALHGPDMRYGPLVPISATRFHLRASQLDLEFAAEGGPAPHLTLIRPDGSEFRYRREA